VCSPEWPASRGESKCYSTTEVLPSAGSVFRDQKGSSGVEAAALPLPTQAAWAAGVLTQWKSIFHRIRVFTEKLSSEDFSCG